MKKTLIILSVVVFLVVAGIVGKVIYDNIYTAEVNKQIEDLGLNPKDYDLDGVSPLRIREEITRQEIEKILLGMGISPDEVDLSGLDFDGLSQEEIFDVVSKKVTADITGKTIQESTGVAPAATTKTSSGSTCSVANKVVRKFSGLPYYDGTLFDTHIHVPVSSAVVSNTAESLGFEDMPAFGGNLTIDHVACLLKTEGTKSALGFFLTTKFSLNQEIGTAKSFEQRYPGLIVPFISPAPYDQLRASVDDVKNTLSENPTLFSGIGELKIFDGTSINNSHFAEMYKIANSNRLLVMMHPFVNDKQVVESIVSKYPQVNFLIHGGDNESWIVEVISKYPNVYYSLDANMNKIYGWSPKHENKTPTKEEYLSFMEDNFDAEVAKELKNWKLIIETYPDRFVWGTDRWYSWHFDTEVSNLAVEFGRTFIGGLSPSVQEKFAYKNAENMLGK